MKVSIITTCFNREQTIGETIKSVLSQNYKDIEYIIVDGASRDDSMKKIKETLKEFPQSNTIIISEPDNGMYEAINKGIRKATGDVIGLIHSDDILFDKQTISDIMEKFEKEDADFVYGDGLFVSNADTKKVIRKWISGKYSKKKIKTGWLPLHPTCYIKRTVIMKEGLYDENYKIAADSDFLVRYLYKANLKVTYLKKYVVRMRMGGLSTNKNQLKKVWDEDVRMYRSHGFPGRITKLMKMARKVPQFIKAKFM